MNRKSTTGFPMSIRRTAYVAPKPPEWAQKRKVTVFPPKIEQLRVPGSSSLGDLFRNSRGSSSEDPREAPKESS